MASMATSEMIFFIATLVISAAVVGVLGTQTSHLALGMESSSQNTAQTIQTDFEIINNPSQIPYSNGYVFYIKNTGSDGFYFTNDSVSVLLNGTILTGTQISLVVTNTTGELMPSQVGEIIVKVAIGTGYNQLTVILSDGISKSLEFQI